MIDNATLGEVLNLRNEIVHPRDYPKGHAVFVGLEHVQSHTGRKVGEASLDLSKLTGRKSRFHPGDLVYGYLRPYLNKLWIAEHDGFCSVDQYVFTVNEERADRDYVAYFMRSPRYLEAAPIDATPGQLPRIRVEEVAAVPIPLPSKNEQRRIARLLRVKFAELDSCRKALADQLDAAEKLPLSLVRESMLDGYQEVRLEEVLDEISAGVGSDWRARPLLGASRGGLSLAKEPIGKSPERYKPVHPGCIFYNPMRVLLGSIAFVEEGLGIVSPDYVAFTTKEGCLHSRWFYHWLRSELGEHFIKGLARGAVRERILFNRLMEGVVSIPSWERQIVAVQKMQRIPDLRASLADQLAALDRYPAALLREAFAGRL
jgi:type I restriction enzyme S subunit